MSEREITDVDCLLRFYPKSGLSVAVTNGIDEELIFLPLKEIEIFETDKFEGAYQLVTITMPVWLAEEKGLV